MEPAAEELSGKPARAVLLAELWRRFSPAGNGCIVLLHRQGGDIAFALGLRSGTVWYLIFTEVAATEPASRPGSQLTCQALQAMTAQRPGDRIELNCGWRYSRGLETGAYQVRRLRAVPRGSLRDLLLQAEGLWRRVWGRDRAERPRSSGRTYAPWPQEDG